MATIRVSHNKNYTVISNNAIRDNRLSLKARGLHHLLLSYPDGWKINIAHLSSENVSEKDGKTAIASALNELEDFGYLTREQVRDEKTGFLIGWEQVVYEIPKEGFEPISRKPENRINRKSDKPDADNPKIGKPDDILNTDSDQVLNSNQLLINQEHQNKGWGESNHEGYNTQPSSCIKEDLPHAENNSTGSKNAAAQVEVVTTSSKQDPFLNRRPFLAAKGTYKSVATDPWMESSHNVKNDFAEWVHLKRYKSQGKLVSDAKAEIRNNYERASDLWEEYQKEIVERDRIQQVIQSSSETQDRDAIYQMRLTQSERPQVKQARRWTKGQGAV